MHLHLCAKIEGLLQLLQALCQRKGYVRLGHGFVVQEARCVQETCVALFEGGVKTGEVLGKTCLGYGWKLSSALLLAKAIKSLADERDCYREGTTGRVV